MDIIITGFSITQSVIENLLGEIVSGSLNENYPFCSPKNPNLLLFPLIPSWVPLLVSPPLLSP